MNNLLNGVEHFEYKANPMLFAAAAAGAASAGIAAYMLDPVSGNRRRAVLRDKARHYGKQTAHMADVTTRDVSNRARGLVAEARYRRNAGPTSDETLTARVASKLGHVCSHPGAISITAKDGHVILTGSIFKKELRKVLRTLSAVPGVESLENGLKVYKTSENLPDLQGETHPVSRFQWNLLQRSWTPTTKLLVFLAGAGTLLAGAEYLRRANA